MICFLLSCAPSARFSARSDFKNTETSGNLKEGASFYGEASYYADKFHGRKTANGETFDMYGISAAHKSLPFDTILLVTNLDNNISIRVRVNDRGPYAKGRVLDLSYGAAKKIDMLDSGVARVKIKIERLGGK